MKKKKPIHPDTFRRMIKSLIDKLGEDEEACHGKTDDAMEELLISLGYGGGIKLIRNTTRWCA